MQPFIYEPFISLKEFLEEFPDETPSNLYDRIKQAAREAEHLIVSIISEENQPQRCAPLTGKSKLKRQVKMIMEQTNSISIEVRNMKHNKAATIKDAVQTGASSTAAGMLSTVGENPASWKAIAEDFPEQSGTSASTRRFETSFIFE
ncbi:hypothetical protein SASPL_112485 [Salvia splendens]|uniref:Uncharacterized protein n=1 Tax=Salvia splendens TaxID=180675 RepID=A0A8X9A647_SALSN|nr:hypothetical protein SASPL_112485 [Salvia splendens]